MLVTKPGQRATASKHFKLHMALIWKASSRQRVAHFQNKYCLPAAFCAALVCLNTAVSRTILQKTGATILHKDFSALVD